MGTKPKVRFYTQFDDIDAELFSVRELTSGDLIVTLKSPPFHEQSIGQTLPMVDYRFTAHVSPQSSGHTFTETVTLANGSLIRAQSFVDCSFDPLLTPLFVRRYPRLYDPCFRMAAREKDRTVLTSSYIPARFNLVTHVLISAPKVWAPDPANWPWRHVTVSFRAFDLHVVPMFMPIPSFEQGDTVLYDTSRQADDGLVARSLHPDDLAGEMIRMNEVLSQKLRIRGMTIMAYDGVLAMHMQELLRIERATSTFLPLGPE